MELGSEIPLIGVGGVFTKEDYEGKISRRELGSGLYWFHLRRTSHCEKNPILAGHVAQTISSNYSV